MVRASGGDLRAFYHLSQGCNAKLKGNVHKLSVFFQAIVAAAKRAVNASTHANR
jgi:hypothetical protein